MEVLRSLARSTHRESILGELISDKSVRSYSQDIGILVVNLVLACLRSRVLGRGCDEALFSEKTFFQ